MSKPCYIWMTHVEDRAEDRLPLCHVVDVRLFGQVAVRSKESTKAARAVRLSEPFRRRRPSQTRRTSRPGNNLDVTFLFILR